MEIVYCIIVLLALLGLYSARCPDSSDVYLDTSCHRSHNETCSYTCKQGYQPTNLSDGNHVICTTTSAWNRPLSSLCEKLKCPTTISHGNISTVCSREYDSWCDYYNCDSGYVKPSNYQTLVCNASGHWNWWLRGSNLHFCVSEDDLCPSVIKNGRLDPPCGRDEGDHCYFSCDDGCKKNYDIYKLTCHNKTWDSDTDTLCTDCLQCNHTFSGGFVYMGNCYAGKVCNYACYNHMRYAGNENITTVICSNVTNTWVSSDPIFASIAEDDFCLPRHCSTNIPNGHLLSSCNAEVGSTCRYKCDADFIGNVSEIYCASYQYTYAHEVETYWNVTDMRQLCTNSKQCPLESIPGVLLDQECTRNPGDTCSYTCDYGYRPTIHPFNQTTITCNSSSMWNESFSGLCMRIVCPTTIPNGYVECSHKTYDNNCFSYSCNDGYQPSQDYPAYLKCNYNGEWQWNSPSPLEFCLSEDELCPSTIHGGHFHACHRREGSLCSYYCYGCKNYSAPYYLHCRNKTWDADTRYLCTECTTTTTTTTVAPVRCPSYIPGGDLSYRCDRTPGTWCSYYCDSGCTKQYVSLLCNSYSEWQSGDWACTCPKCPYYIPNGYISSFSYDFSTCDYKPGSTCDVECNVGCQVGYSTAYCLSTGKWSSADSLCNCKESTFSNKDTSDGGSTSTVAVVLSVVGIIAFFVIVAGVITKFRRQCSQPTPPRASTSQASPQHAPYTNTIATNNTHGTNANNTQGTQEGAQTCFNASYIQGPPPYSELSFPKEVESTPTTPPPPSYEEVTSNPLELMTQQTTNSTQETNSSNSVNENDFTPL